MTSLTQSERKVSLPASKRGLRSSSQIEKTLFGLYIIDITDVIIIVIIIKIRIIIIIKKIIVKVKIIVIVIVTITLFTYFQRVD